MVPSKWRVVIVPGAGPGSGWLPCGIASAGCGWACAMDKIEVNTNMASRNSFLMAARVPEGCVFGKVQGYHRAVGEALSQGALRLELRQPVRFQPAIQPTRLS